VKDDITGIVTRNQTENGLVLVRPRFPFESGLRTIEDESAEQAKKGAQVSKKSLPTSHFIY